MMKKIVPIILVLGLVISLITIPTVSADDIRTYIVVYPQGPIHTTQNTKELKIKAILAASPSAPLPHRYLDFDLYNSKGQIILNTCQMTDLAAMGTCFKFSSEILSKLPPGDYRAKISYKGPHKVYRTYASCCKIVEIHHTRK
jgi:hypothetical protein